MDSKLVLKHKVNYKWRYQRLHQPGAREEQAPEADLPRGLAAEVPAQFRGMGGVQKMLGGGSKKGGRDMHKYRQTDAERVYQLLRAAVALLKYFLRTIKLSKEVLYTHTYETDTQERR